MGQMWRPHGCGTRLLTFLSLVMAVNSHRFRTTANLFFGTYSKRFPRKKPAGRLQLAANWNVLLLFNAVHFLQRLTAQLNGVIGLTHRETGESVVKQRKC